MHAGAPPAYLEVMDSPIGPLALAASPEHLLRVDLRGNLWDLALEVGQSFAVVHAPNKLVERAKVQLEQYFAGERREFDLPLPPRSAGAGFTEIAQERLCEIPYGQVLTYGQYARHLGNPGAARAVGTACRKNPLPLVRPCHRVVAAGGIGGYGGGAGPGVAGKRWLLRLEGLDF